MTKTLIIATGRCGSSALARAVKEAYMCDEFYDEPFNPDLNTVNAQTGVREFDEAKGKSFDFSAPYQEVPPNTVWKCLLTLNNYPKEFWNINIEDFFLEFSKQFENVILLSRRNHAERLYSMLHGIQHSTWHRRYDALPVSITYDTFETINDFVEQNNRIEFLVDMMENQKIFYYEDLFTNQEQSEKTWAKMMGNSNNFESIYLRWLNPDLRYRK